MLVFVPLLRPTWTTKFIKRNKKSPSFDHLASHCADVAPITASEFYKRQHALAETLHSLGASAYVAEPGANAHFFTNVSSSRWHLSERPFLLVIAPEVVSDKKVKPRISVITPRFEATRAHLLSIPAKENVSFFEWDEDSSPYLTAISALGTNGEKIYVDGDIRKFIADGLAGVLPENEVLTAPLEVKSLRERKSDSEIEILRCANEVILFTYPSEHSIFLILTGQIGDTFGYTLCQEGNVHRNARIRGPKSREYKQINWKLAAGNFINKLSKNV